MCFSAPASFVTAGLTGAVGIAALGRARHRRELPLAAVPLFFAVQQGIEGLLWLYLPAAPQGPAASGLSLAFLIFAEVFWPVYVPLAVLLVEPVGRRARLILPFLIVGAALGAYLLEWLLTRPHGAYVAERHVAYVTGHGDSLAVALSYLAATTLPPLLSSQRTIVVLGAIILVGSVVAFAFYWEAFVSVWCFFAAAASLVVLGHFELARRRPVEGAA